MQCINDSQWRCTSRHLHSAQGYLFFCTLICWAVEARSSLMLKRATRVSLFVLWVSGAMRRSFFCPAGNGIFTEVEISYDDLVASVSPLFARICSEEREIYDVVWKLSIRLLGGRFSVKSGTFVMIYLALWKVALQKSKVHRKLMAIESNSFGWNAPQEQLRNVRNEMYETPPRGL